MTIRDGFPGAVGATPLIRIASLSEATGCQILGKAEHLNPGGSVKDRAARHIVQTAEADGKLGGDSGVTELVEGTAGNTGIGLALMCRARGYACHIVMPDNQSAEKIDLLRALGAELHLVPPRPFADDGNYYHVARRLAEERGAFWADQFENLANARAHHETTGPELVAAGRVDGFVCASGTGGTIAGVSSYLKEQVPGVQCWLVDCEGSSLYSHVNHGTLDASGSSVLEGIGIRRITANFARARLDGAFVGTDREAIEMVHWLLRRDGLFVGGSAGLNCAGAVKLARHLGPGKTIVTILTDGAGRYTSRLFSDAWLAAKGLTPQAPDLSFVR